MDEFLRHYIAWKKTDLKGLHTVWIHLCDMSEQKTDQWFPGTGNPWGWEKGMATKG